MEMLSVDLCETPVTIATYQAYELQSLPKVVLGFQIKNKFDEDRLLFKDVYKAKRISHFVFTSALEPVFFYGVELQPTNADILKLINDLNSFSGIYINCKSVSEFQNAYSKRLMQDKLSCDTCFKYLRDGVYPVDLKHVSSFLGDNKTIPVGDIASMLDVPKEQWYLHIGGVGIYVLGACSSYYFNI